MELSKRLTAIMDFAEQGSRVADVGTDHGFVPICLVENGIAVSAVALDVNRGPLKRAEEHIREAGLEQKISVRLSDGLEKLLPGEADTVIIAGMGGQLIMRILESGVHVTDSIGQFILSPQSELERVRRFLNGRGLILADEDMVYEDGKYYTIMNVRHGEECPGTYIENKYGRVLLKKKHPVLLDYLNKEKRALTELEEKLIQSGTKGAAKRLEEIRKEIEHINSALKWYE